MRKRKTRVNVGKRKSYEVLEAWKWGSNACDTERRTVGGSGCFKYLGSQVAADGGCERDVIHRMNEVYRAWGALKSLLSNRGLGIKAKKCPFERVIAPTALYGAEAWGMRSSERRKVNVLERTYLKSLVRVSRMDTDGN